jgi:hypothetical protein
MPGGVPGFEVRSPNMLSSRFAIVAVVSLAGSCLAQTDSFHLMQIEQVIGGINGDATRQAIQLRMRSSFQNQMQNARLKAWDAAGANPVVIIAFPSPVANAVAGDHILVTTAVFDSATSPACSPDFHMTSPIPASYLAAGRLTFEDNFGTIYWSLAWGGASYTGSTMGSLTNCPTGNFGPPFPGPLPSTSTRALLTNLDVSATSTGNATDYALTPSSATFTNNAHANFGVIPCYANCDDSTVPPTLNVLDFSCFLNRFAAGDSYANCDNSTTPPVLNVLDFACFLNRIAAGCV